MLLNIDEYLPTEFAKVDGVYFAREEDWHYFASYSEFIVEYGITEFLFEVTARYQDDSVVVAELVDLDTDDLNMGEWPRVLNYTPLSEDPRYVFKYMVL